MPRSTSEAAGKEVFISGVFIELFIEKRISMIENKIFYKLKKKNWALKAFAIKHYSEQKILKLLRLKLFYQRKKNTTLILYKEYIKNNFQVSNNSQTCTIPKQLQLIIHIPKWRFAS